MFQQQNAQAQFFSFSATIDQIGTLISCLTSSMSHTWIIDSEMTDHMIVNRFIKSFFTLASYSNPVVLIDGSHTPIQGIGTATTTPLFLYHFFSIYLICLSTYYQ